VEYFYLQTEKKKNGRCQLSNVEALADGEKQPGSLVVLGMAI
jgi:hypothetical protein